MWPSRQVSRRLVVALVMAMGMLSSRSPRAQDELQTGTLRGIASVNIVVDPLAPIVVHLGVTQQTVASEVQRLLRGHDVLVNGTASDAQITVRINAVEIKTRSGATSGIAYTVSVSVEQEATLQRTGVTARVTTWRHAGIGVAAVAKANAVIRAQLAEYLEAFIAAYRSANKAAG